MRAWTTTAWTKPAVSLLIVGFAVMACAATPGTTPGRGVPTGPAASTADTTKVAPGTEQDHGNVAGGQTGMTQGAIGAGPVAPTTVGSGSAGVAMVYPGYAGSGVAPEKTIVASGSGSADMKVDQSDRTAAEQKAVAAAVADAKRQANAVAGSIGVQIEGVYSVSVSASASSVYPEPNCLVPPVNPAAGPSTSSAPLTPKCAPVSSQPTTAQVYVTVVVAFSFR